VDSPQSDVEVASPMVPRTVCPLLITEILQRDSHKVEYGGGAHKWVHTMYYTNPYGKKFYISATELKQYKNGQGAQIMLTCDDPHHTMSTMKSRSSNHQILLDGMAMVPLSGKTEVGTILTLDGRIENKTHLNKDFLFVINDLGTYFIKHVLSDKWIGLDDVIVPTKLILVNEATHVSFTDPILTP